MTGNNSSEQIAISQIQNGNIQGLEYLVHTFQQEALRTANMITRDAQQAEEVVQESFLYAYKRIKTFDKNRPFKPWFRRLVLNNAIKATKKSARNVLLSTLNSDNSLSPKTLLFSALPTLEDQVSAKMLEKEVWDALEKLTPKQRAVVVAYYYLDMKEREIATTLNIPKGTVKWRLHSAKKRLKLFLTFK